MYRVTLLYGGCGTRGVEPVTAFLVSLFAHARPAPGSSRDQCRFTVINACCRVQLRVTGCREDGVPATDGLPSIAESLCPAGIIGSSSPTTGPTRAVAGTEGSCHEPTMGINGNSPGATCTASVAPASAMLRIAAGSGDCLRGTFLRYGLLRCWRVEVEQALNFWSPPQMKSP